MPWPGVDALDRGLPWNSRGVKCAIELSFAGDCRNISKSNALSPNPASCNRGDAQTPPGD